MQPPKVPAIKHGKVFVPKEFRPVSGQKTVERICTHEIQVEMIGLEHSLLLRSFPEHRAPLPLLKEAYSMNELKSRTFRPGF